MLIRLAGWLIPILTNDRFREGFRRVIKTTKKGRLSFSKLILDCILSFCYSVTSIDNSPENGKPCTSAMPGCPPRTRT